MTPVRVVIVEDNPSDAMLVRMALDAAGVMHEAHVIADGESAIAQLTSALSGQRPDLVILDLNLPKRPGTEVLEVIRGSALLAGLPVVVLSSWPQEALERAMSNALLSADGYFTKPPTLDGFLALGAAIRTCYESVRHRAAGC